MPNGIERQPPRFLGGRIAQRQRRPTVSHLVEHDSDDEARDEDQRKLERFGHAAHVVRPSASLKWWRQSAT